MDIFYRIVSLLGGLALFLYGMRIMGDGLKSSSGGAMKAALARVTTKPIMGFLLGVIVTCMIQSSTATIVLTVGLVGAGFLSFRQSIGIVLGANVGTAITAQIIRLMDLDAGSSSILYFFKSDNLAPLALTIGIIIIMFVKKKGAGATGTIFMGFGILFVGLMNMSAAVSSMSGQLSKLLVSFEDNYVLGFLAGVAVTGVIQSSSAVVGILQSIASSVGVTFCGVFAVIVGVNIGDCLTTFLVCRIGAKTEQIRVCLVHILYNVCAALLIFATLAVLRATGVLGDNLWYMSLDSGGVANVHGLFRLVPAVLLLPFSGFFAKAAEKIAPDKPLDEEDADIEQNLRDLDMHLITTPGLALAESEHLIGHMAEVSLKNYKASVNQIAEFREKRNGKIMHREDLLDRMADACNQYIVAVSPYVTRQVDNRTQNFQLRALVAFERIGDLSVDMNESAGKMVEAKTQFSDDAKFELAVVTDAVRDILSTTVTAIKNNDIQKAQKVEPMEEVIDELIEELRSHHVYRMTRHLCDAFHGIEFQNILNYLERISDQCSDVAVYLLGRYDDAIDGHEHQYIHVLHHSDDPEYLEEFQANYQKYFGQMKAQAILEAEAEQEEKGTDAPPKTAPREEVLPGQETAGTDAKEQAPEAVLDKQE